MYGLLELFNTAREVAVEELEKEDEVQKAIVPDEDFTTVLTSSSKLLKPGIKRCPVFGASLAYDVTA